ncbi:pimeloyl-ACP methyl ester carboxylesterase [Geodermatophilus bullaregiensis]|uniref:alpha/beta fold hydrolase n=1 Tax=Geodermatophilus bullaregiensis TaxID=1564160 RepID=UPI0019563C70|nr:alpha/beta hydrolase [Geodermatophilus bullaregiensis]MBM7804510.1 pimeloyl-ACP methyl ester carboxylesterase [Geodermatophilus bullaregiensis]
MTAPRTHTLETAGAVVTYDVRPGDGPPLLLVGSPMGASGFASLAAHFPDRTVVTYDPRGADRSRRTDGAAESTPEEHADDLSRLITALGAGPVDVFASSGGAVNALVLVARHPEQVRTLVAHEPPAAALVPDRETALAASRRVRETYQRSGFGAGMAEFIRLVMHRGPVPADLGPTPDPAAFGLPADDDGSRDDVLLAQNIVSCTHHEHDVDALRAASSRIVIAVGEGSAGELAHRGGEAVAERLGTTPVVFPGDHGSFLDSEYGQPADVDAVARKLREVLAAEDRVPAGG